MKLTSGELYWPTTYQGRSIGRRLTGDVSCEALVVGAGVSGAMAAYRLAQAGVNVVVIDRDEVVTGSTPASTALVLYEIDVPLRELRAKIGKAGADAAYRASHGAVAELRRLVAGLDDTCDLRRRPSVYLASKATEVRSLRAEAKARRTLGIDAEFIGPRALRDRFGFDRPGAIVSSRAYEVNPVRLTHALLRGATRLGASVYHNTPVKTWTLSQPLGKGGWSGARVRAGRFTVHADWVIIATGYQAPEQFAIVNRMTRLRSTFALATAPLAQEPWPEGAMVWETADPYIYARLSADKRVIFGGEDVHTTDPRRRERLIKSKCRTLERRLRSLAPGRRLKTDFRWAGTFAETEDGLPFIGEHPEFARVLFALGYGGNGLTFSVIAAKSVTRRVRGKPDRLGSLFSFARSGPARGAE